jgi:hypothetical protein
MADSQTNTHKRICAGCGKEFFPRLAPSDVKHGWGTYCNKSCSNTANGTKHGHRTRMNTSPTYKTWCAMLRRCNQPNASNYPLYGGRGIKVADEWLLFENFLRDMGERPKGATLDRHPDKDGDYTKSNCRWAFGSEQQRNRRTNVLVTYDDRTQCVSAWAEEFSVNVDTLRGRLYLGRCPFGRHPAAHRDGGHVYRLAFRVIDLPAERAARIAGLVVAFEQRRFAGTFRTLHDFHLLIDSLSRAPQSPLHVRMVSRVPE